MTKEELMCRAFALSENSVRCGGGPFGAVNDQEIAVAPHERKRPMESMLPEEAIRAFEMWEEKPDKTEY